MPDPRSLFLLIMVWIAGRRKAIVFPVPVFAWAKQSTRFARRSRNVAACTGITRKALAWFNAVHG